jgi:AcrR family transcriptional regulator
MTPQPPALGLRERKKARTRAAIQEHALDLFRRQGYAATTIEQIVAAADVSESTFFRYFPSKEHVVLADGLVPRFTAAFRAQPAQPDTVPQLRAAMHAVFEQLTPEQLAELRERSALTFRAAELRGAALARLADDTDAVAAVVAQRRGRPSDDPAMRAFAGALTGALITLLRTWAEHPGIDIAAAADHTMASLRVGE